MTNEKNVRIRIFAIVQRGEDDDIEKDNIRITSDGVMRETDDRIEISYQEMMEDVGVNSATVSFSKKEPDIVTLTREGDITSMMTFSKKCRYSGTYHADFASFEFTVATRRVENKLNMEKGGSLLLDYNTEIQGVSVQNSRFRYTVTPI